MINKQGWCSSLRKYCNSLLASSQNTCAVAGLHDLRHVLERVTVKPVKCGSAGETVKKNTSKPEKYIINRSTRLLSGLHLQSEVQHGAGWPGFGAWMMSWEDMTHFKDGFSRRSDASHGCGQ